MREILDGALFIADAHDNANKKGFLNFLKSLKNGAISTPPQLFIMGDMFDYLSNTTYSKEFFKDQIELLNELSKEMEIYYFEGNHDYNLAKIFPNIEVFNIYAQPQIFTDKFGQKVSLAHGDIFLKPFESLALRFLRNKAFLWIMDLIDRFFKFRISKLILAAQAIKRLDYKIVDFEFVIGAKIYNYQTPKIIEGHYHQGVNLQFDDKFYINLPCFACEQRYFIVEYTDEMKFQILRSPNV
ncbi:UDP-2,3-diacylglucosamine diphosphatase [Campylobacter hyointestinalis]|uniref:UDP-2,3-diacylglucosamine diphosphatase n=1 Tax=Campylobacter hyointestinalis TaxID=198 RepID=UPI001BD4EBA8|nr:metallophosphoesterase [Campylobacter hyointestinalis]MBT0611184.1 UDP-2,3-diacylglucosamine diphosphatase [Campylobacter hyointestinalis subsp. hyointestinalis]MDY2998400.1 UDP-2,3-diacylglucosamine diphosphatase [Campylobacter hyointestinalis]